MCLNCGLESLSRHRLLHLSRRRHRLLHLPWGRHWGMLRIDLAWGRRLRREVRMLLVHILLWRRCCRMMSIGAISILLLLLLMLLWLEIMRRILLALLEHLCLVLPILRYGLHLRHLMVRLGEDLVVRLILLVAHVCHSISIAILRLLKALLHGRHLREAIERRPVGLRAPVVVVHRSDIECRGSPPSTRPNSCDKAPMVLSVDRIHFGSSISSLAATSCLHSCVWPSEDRSRKHPPSSS